ncbi:MAG: glycosyltransferase, partial [Planctomycetaceae bacterium]|nr:glycosyltransferase [Planctomycetaceae bacterium]
MRLSLIIAAHNEGPALWKTVASCVETCAGLDYEIVVADDASFDDSLVELRRRFPSIRLVSVDERQGASPAKDLGAQEARGEVLIFLDGHCKPEDGAIRRLLEGVEQQQGQAIITPGIAALDVERWKSSPRQIGHGYFVELEDFHCGWLPLSELHLVQEKRRRFYESPALIGCALALSRELYDDLRGFDPHMRMWGVEDLDFGLKCWLMGHRILHDPEAIVGHRFRRSFDNYSVPVEHIAVNQLRMARKNFTDGVWSSWLTACRERHQGALPEHPEGLWARIWELFLERRESVEHERSYLLARRKHDEFWFAEKFGLSWPRLQGTGVALPRGLESAPMALGAAGAMLSPSPSPSPSPPPDDPEPPPEPCNPDEGCCDCGCSSAPVRYFNGQIRLSATDLTSSGFGVSWGHERVYCNLLSHAADLGQGYNWLVFQWSYLVDHQDGAITVVRGTQGSWWFDPSGGGYTGRYGAKATLVHDTERHRFVLTQLTGTVLEFHDFDQMDNPEGSFARQIQPGGEVTEVSSYTDNDLIAEIRRSGTVGGATITEAFVYTYSEAGRVLTATLRRQLVGGGWEEVLRAVYDYYGPASSFGSEGDLERVRRQVPTSSGWADLETDYYRYWLDGDDHGFKHGLKFVVKPAAYVKLQAAGYDPLMVSNAILSTFADHYFEYDEQDRVVLERIDGGSRTFTFSFTEGFESTDFNVWARKTIETLPNGNQNIVYTNRVGQFLIKELRSGSQRWIDAWQYDASSRRVQHARPSAVIGYDQTYPDLQIALRVADGLIELTEYYASSGSGAAAGYVAAEKLKRGSGGTPVVQRRYEYAPQTVSGSTVYKLSKETIYRNEDGTGALETSFAHTFYSGTTQVQQRTTTLPVVPTDQNGSGVAATRKEYFDTSSRRTWAMDERGFIAHNVYNLATGALIRQIQDVDTTQVVGAPPGWTTPAGGGLNLITDAISDDQGRITQSLGPSHTVDLSGTATTIRRAEWTVYDDVNHVTYSAGGYAAGSGPNYSFALINPVSIAKRDANGKILEEIQATAASTSGTLAEIIIAAGGGSAAFPQTSYVRWTTYQYTDCCLAVSLRVYHLIPASGPGVSGTNYDQTNYGYDVMKRRNRTVTPGGTITDIVFDPRGLSLTTHIGTNDDGGTAADPTGGGSNSNNNMVLVTENEYDGGQAGGDGNLTQQTQYATASDTRVTAFTYDWRDRRITTDGEVDVFETLTYDNLNRIVKAERYDTTEAGHLVARNETHYDNRSRVFEIIRYGIDPSTGTVGNSLEENNWYDAVGNLLKSLPSGSNLFTKSVYDSIGRVTARYVGYDADETSYSDAGSVTDDVILEQTETAYDAASNVLQSTVRQRYHNAPDTQFGSLGNPSTNPKARVTYQAQWADALGRMIASADYGTNGGSVLSRPATIPARSDTVLVTTTVYDPTGFVESTTDPASVVSRFSYDDRGREMERIGNYQGSSPSTTGCTASDDINVTIRTAYNADGNVSSLTAVNTATGNQVTQYVYGTTLADSEIASSLLKRAEIYPDSTGGSDQITFAYNRQQQKIQVTDQGGTVHVYDYDKLSRQTQDRVTAVGIGIDGVVRRIATTYEVRGLRAAITSYDNFTVGSGMVLNESQFVYNNFGQLVIEYQSHSGAVTPSTTPQVRYGYANGAANTIRPTSLTYPNERVLTFSYGDAGSIGDQASRIVSVVDEDDTHLVDYDYLGRGTFVIADDTEPDMLWTLASLTGSDDPETGDIYTGLDRFGRIKDNRWYDYGSSVDIDRIQYGYDRASNRLWRQNAVASALSAEFDELYNYDGIHRLKDMARGTLNVPRTSLTSVTFAQCWTLDSTGNWQGFREDGNGDGTWDLIQARTANKVNEITDISETAGPSWVTPVYSTTGNMTTIPKPNNPTQGYSAIYDAWNRLVQIADGSDTVSQYAYDGVRRRIIQKSYTSGTLSETRHLYYTQPNQWQVIEERLGTSTDAERQFVWGLRYIDDCVLRDRDTNADGTLDQRLYACQDANWNVTALVDAVGDAQERYAYSAYGIPLFLTPTFGIRTASSFGWETLYCGYRYENTTGLFHVRNRVYHPMLGSWLQRDLIR